MAERVRVMVRLRPTNEQERKNKKETPVAFAEDNAIVVTGDRERQHTFDRSFSHDATQEEVFEAVGGSTVANVLKGFNGTVLAYGQTGSGKTHTMLGPAGGNVQALDEASVQYSARGLIPRIAESLFERLVKYDPAEVSWAVHVSVFELYKEQIYDSLAENPLEPSEYRIREDVAGGRGIYVDKLFAKPCLSAPEVLEAIRVGANRRKVAATGSNETSSRSHSITQLQLAQTNHLMGDTVTVSRLTLVDLAGSEKVGKTQAGGDRLKEAQSINLSLTLLGNVIFKLTDGKSTYIPYRDSKLTRLLQDSLGGNSMTTLLCCASPAEFNREETVSTLAFAARAKQITNKPRVNRDLSSGELKAALAKALDEIADLKERMAMQAEFAQRHHMQSPRRSAQVSVQNGEEMLAAARAGAESGDADAEDKAEELNRIIARLMDEISDLKAQLRDRDERLETAERQIDFHRKRAADAEELVAQLQAKLKREEQLFQRRLLEIQTSGAKGGDAVLVDAVPQPRPVPPAEGGPVDLPTVQRAGSGQRLVRRPSRDTGRQRLATESGGLQAGTKVGTRGDTSAVTLEPSVQRIDSQATRQQATQNAMLGPSGRPSVGRGGRRPGSGSTRVTAPETIGDAAPVSIVPQRDMLLDADVPSASPTGPSTTALELRIQELESALEKLRRDLAASEEREGTTTRKLRSVEDEYEQLGERSHQQQREIERLQGELAASQSRCADLTRILEALNIDVEEQLALERRRAADASSEASKLRNDNDQLREAQGQQEFLDMAAAELLFKTEDLEAVENDVVAVRFAHADDEHMAGVRRACLDTLKQLDEFTEHVLDRLKGRTFATANLETLRLNVISDASDMQNRVSLSLTRLRRDT